MTDEEIIALAEKTREDMTLEEALVENYITMDNLGVQRIMICFTVMRLVHSEMRR